ncbi:hypothetical protein [uncultured Chryseobacterium sp.]|uniref:hypothetical protein n=1 Tax=uncultured Chryseobacterium sp. TaxID=259322 RepID=UPI0025E8C3A0|nr:hypothetical protein [uncultured Chryseobacterium sp.]
MNTMKVLIACEESQTVTKEFRKLGFEAFSCDIQDCSGGHPEWHIKGDAINEAYSGKYDLMIAHPPCTHIAQAGGRWFERKRLDGSQRDALIFFTKLCAAPIKLKAVENPKGILSSDWYIQKHFPEIMNFLSCHKLPRKPDQKLHPYHFGDPKQKETHFWLFGLPKLEHTEVVEPEQHRGVITRKGNYRPGSTRPMTWLDFATPKEKSKTFPGIAAAMANQWGNFLKEITQ